MKLDELIAIDVHTHAEVSCRQEPDEAWKRFAEASSRYFKAGQRPTIAETIAYYRERKIGLVMFTVDSEFQIGAKRIPNEEIADAARANSDIMLAFASIDPHKGRRARSAPPDRRRSHPGLQVPSWARTASSTATHSTTATICCSSTRRRCSIIWFRAGATCSTSASMCCCMT